MTIKNRLKKLEGKSEERMIQPTINPYRINPATGGRYRDDTPEDKARHPYPMAILDSACLSRLQREIAEQYPQEPEQRPMTRDEYLKDIQQGIKPDSSKP